LRKKFFVEELKNLTILAKNSDTSTQNKAEKERNINGIKNNIYYIMYREKGAM